MLAKRSGWLSSVLSSAVVAASLLSPVAMQPIFAQQAPKPAAADKQLTSLADDYLYYSIVGNIGLAKASAEAALKQNATPEQFLNAFESASKERDIYGIIARNQRNKDLAEISAKVLEKLEQGHRDVARDPNRIRDEIMRLDDSPRAYNNAKERLTASGPFAVPFYIQTLHDKSKASVHPYILRLMGEIGRPLLPALIEALNLPEGSDKVMIARIIGQIGYPQAAPALLALVDDSATPGDVKTAASQALIQIDGRKEWNKLSAADAYLKLAETFYNHHTSVAAPYPEESANPVWYYDKGLGNVVNVQVPTAIWYDVQASRAAEKSLGLNKDKDQAISLWLAANLRREIYLPQGAKDPARVEGQSDAMYYAVAAGPRYINPVLAMALDDRDSPLAARAVQALEATAGAQNLVAPNRDGTVPLVKALSYPDRGVRFTAAFALARANPNKDFPGSFRVIPVLSEAISQTGTPAAIVVDPDQETRNKLKGLLTELKYNVYEGATLSSVLDAARKEAAFDIVLVSTNEFSRVREVSRTDYRLATAPVAVTGTAEQLPQIRVMTANQPGVVELASNADKATLAAAVKAAGAEQFGVKMDDATATQFSLAAISALSNLAENKACIYNVNEAVPALADALKDKRSDISLGAAGVLGQLQSPDAQKALADAALNSNGDAKTRQALFMSLAESAKRTGNVLDGSAIEQLTKIATGEKEATVRSAAAAALGALSVKSNEASALILGQSK